jgi:hypothetical protein
MFEQLDLVDEMGWEDSDKIEFISLEEAGLENMDYDNLGFSFFDNYFIEEM